MLCRKCGTIIASDWPGEWHVGCYPDFERMPGFDMTCFDVELREDLIEIALWAQRHSRRSQQVALGCSEAGHDCDLRLAYRMAGMPAVHHGGDPWPAIVGTATHSWWEQAIADYQGTHSIDRWVSELEVHPSPIVQGHTDLYDAEKFLVLDFKFPSSDNIKKMRLNGPSAQYVTQVQLYGLGHVQAGRRVDRVGIVALGRQGWLKDMWVWTVPFDRGVADAALQRIYDLGDRMMKLGLPDSGVWEEIERSPARLCSWCPYWNRDEKTAGANGCPGK
jgi:hypothetical protein